MTERVGQWIMYIDQHKNGQTDVLIARITAVSVEIKSKFLVATVEQQRVVKQLNKKDSIFGVLRFDGQTVTLEQGFWKVISEEEALAWEL